MIRKATFDDIPRLVELGRVMHAEAPNFRAMAFDPERLAMTLQTVIESDRGFAWVIEGDEVVGGLIAMAVPHWFSPEVTACDLALFVLPEHRGGIGCARLLNRYRSWAAGLGATKIQLGIMTGVHVEQTRALCERLGWHCAGVVMEA